ncbi:MAG: DUF1223 domain-containing protein [Pseudomonadota bacterium]
MRQFLKPMKAAVAATLALSIWAWSPPDAFAGDDARIAVVELFTSQGCSSCPPADKVLGNLTNDPNVLAMSLNVDYWDYLGWKDTVGSPENSRRQREYAVRRGDGRVYTPQIVVSGGNHVVGSYEGRVRSEIKSVLSKPADAFVPVDVTAKGQEVTIEVGEAGAGVAAKDATLWLMLITRKVEQEIPRGENRGRKIAYYNVVRKMLPVGMWYGKAMTVNLPKSGLMAEGVEDCVAVLQVDGTGPIIGASRLSDLTQTATN